MQHFNYLIIGGGLTGDSAVRGIRELDKDGLIGMFSMEPDPPYSRPSLSKSLWKGRPLEKIWRNTQDLGIELHLTSKITHLDAKQKSVLDDQGNSYSYDRLLLATGGSPVRLPFGADWIIYFRDLQDYRRLRTLSETGNDFLVIGGGFIGSEIAAALAMNGKKVTMIFLEDAVGANIYPADLARFITDYYRQKGVEVIPQDAVTSLEKNGDRISIQTRNGRALEVDGVVAGLGIRPNVELAQQAGLNVENGIVVDDFLRTSQPEIYSAGDAANFPYALMHKHMRVEHEDNAITMGKLAGRNMAGAAEHYLHAPMFYSDLFELGYEGVGNLSSKLETFEDWKQPFKEGVIYYLEEGHLRGVLLWNVWDKIPAARNLIAQPNEVTPAELKGKL